MDEQELNKKLAEWAGLANDLELHDFAFYNFTQSLDVCFKQLSPLIEDKGLTLDYVSFRQTSGSYYAEWRIYREKNQVKCGELLASNWQEGTDLEKITILALCLAIEKLIDKEVKGE